MQHCCSYFILWEIKLWQEKYENAAGLYKDSITLPQEIEEKRYLTSARLGLGFMALARVECDTAQQALLERLKILDELGNQPNTIDALIRLADALTHLGEELRAVTLLGAVQEMLGS